MEREIKVGDKVKIVGNVNSHCYKIGDTVTITHIIEKGKIWAEGISQRSGMITPQVLSAEEYVKICYRVIFNGNVTVLIKDDKKYVSKCKDGDTYDKEKGLLLCLAQANGISYRDLQEMIAGAKDCGKKRDKITLSEFLEKYAHIAVNLKNDKEYSTFVKACHKRNHFTSWSEYAVNREFGKEYCLSRYMGYGYCHKEWYEDEGCTVYNFDEVDLEN